MNEDKKLVVPIKQARLKALKTLFGKNTNAEFSRVELFQTVYGNVKQYNEFQIFRLWSKIREDLTTLRSKSFCFVICGKNDKGLHRFRLLKNLDDVKLTAHKWTT